MGGEAERRENLQARVGQYHGVSLEQVLGDIEYLRDAGDSVIAGGSLAYGLGNHLSDLDLIVTGTTTVESSRIPVEHFVGSLRVDVLEARPGTYRGDLRPRRGRARGRGSTARLLR